MFPPSGQQGGWCHARGRARGCQHQGRALARPLGDPARVALGGICLLPTHREGVRGTATWANCCQAHREGTAGNSWPGLMGELGASQGQAGRGTGPPLRAAVPAAVAGAGQRVWLGTQWHKHKPGRGRPATPPQPMPGTLWGVTVSPSPVNG